VARQIKFYNVNLLTAGGLAWDFSEKKNRCVFQDRIWMKDRWSSEVG
jgi:hypothetical protein